MKRITKNNFGLRAMKRSLTLEGAVAAEIGNFALDVVGRRVPDFAPADVIAHLCGATAAILLGSLSRDQAIQSTEGWRLILIEAIKQLADQPHSV